jgi:hypothetical protein
MTEHAQTINKQMRDTLFSMLKNLENFEKESKAEGAPINVANAYKEALKSIAYILGYLNHR